MMLQARSVLGNAFDGVHPIRAPVSSGLYVSELSGGGSVLCAAAVDAADVRKDLADAVGIQLPEQPGVTGDSRGRWAFWMSPRSWLVSVEADREEAVIASVAERFPDRQVHASRFSDYLFWMSISGEGAEDLLRQGGFISLESTGFPVGSMKRTPIAEVPVLVWRHGAADWRLGMERSRATYFVEWMRVCLNDRTHLPPPAGKH